MKVLMVLNNLRVANGVANVIMNQYDSLLKNGYDVDFLQFIDLDSPYVKKIIDNKGKLFTIKKNIASVKEIFKILKYNKYDIIHINQMNIQTIFAIIIAKMLKVKCIIYHAHNTKIPGSKRRKFFEKLCNMMYCFFADKCIACSQNAGEDTFGKKEFLILKNSIDIDRFKFNYEKRIEYRKLLGISNDTFVIGTVCRLAEQKNPMFMLEIMSELIKKRENTVFVWVGSAPFKNSEIEKKINIKIKELGIEKNVLLVGSKEDVYNWYSIMDVFMMPSLWEGLGITYIEAQANSLPTIASEVVPKETKVSELIKYLPLNVSANVWADEINKYPIRNQNSYIVDYDDFVKNGYDLKIAKEDLYKMYSTFM